MNNSTNQEAKNNNNTGVVGATPSGSKAGAAPPDPRSANDDEDDPPMSPDQKAVLLSKKLPVICKMIGRLNRLPVFTQDTMTECREYFERNTDYLPTDVVYMVIMGMKRGREESVPQEGVDPYWWCRHYAHNPNKLWTTNNDGDLILAVMQKELKYIPYDHDENECAALIEREFAALKEQGQTAP